MGNLSGITATAGTYVLTLTAAGSGITDLAGNALAADAADQWLVSLTNPTTFTGTPNADTFEFIAAGAVGGLPTMHQLKLTLAGSPVVTYLYDASGSVALTLRGGGGNDTLRITGGPGMDTSSIYRYAILHVGPAAAGSAGYYSVYAPYADGSFETMVVDGGAGTGQRATLYNGPASGDHFTASSWLRTGSMVGTGTGNVYNNSVKNFDQVYGASTGGGTDARANLSDSNGNDFFVCKTEGANAYSVMQRVSGGTGSAAYLWAGGGGFSNVYGYSTAGGTDEAVLNGSSGNDTAVFQPQARRTYVIKAGGGFFGFALDFKKVTAYPGPGTADEAYLQGTMLDDTFTATAGMAQLSGTIPSMGVPYLDIAADGLPGERWDKVYGQANYPGMIGGVDKANLNGTTGDDTLIAVGKPHATISGVAAGNAQLTGTAYWIQAQAFQQVYVDMKTGNDTANLYDSTAAGVEQFWGGRKVPSTVLSDAVLSDGTLDLNNGNLLAALSYYFRVTGLDSNVNDHVNLYGSLIPPSGENHKHVVNPLDYVLAVSGPWIDL